MIHLDQVDRELCGEGSEIIDYPSNKIGAHLERDNVSYSSASSRGCPMQASPNESSNISGRPTTPARGPPLALNFPVVGIGASAGGLEAFTKLLDGFHKTPAMAFILIQHLEPHHDSMLVELLSSHTTMSICEAADGMAIERGHVYIISPGTYLSISEGRLNVEHQLLTRGARLPFDVLLLSMAKASGSNATCIVLSGTGTDGTLGLKAIKDQSGRVIVQDPDEAEYDGMPRSAIATGRVDMILPLSEISAALNRSNRQNDVEQSDVSTTAEKSLADRVSDIISLLRETTAHDFTHYKHGTLQRRIERRMSMASIDPSNIDGYITRLRTDAVERDSLAKDMLINVTKFFRDPDVFAFLEKEILPDMLREHDTAKPFRIWIAGCSTGEETYSLVMLFREHIANHSSNLRLQVFASDADPDAVAFAREGLYPKTIVDDVSPRRLKRFFTEEDVNYRVLPELRSAVVFTVQDVLVDPPFSRLDMISCRNLLIYLRPEAQAQAISAFHFALRANGILVLGNAETVQNTTGRFALISKSKRVYRQIGRSRPGDFNFALKSIDAGREPEGKSLRKIASGKDALAELCKRLVLDNYAPAALLLDHKLECIYTLGPTDRYLRVAAGVPTQNILAMARQDVRTKLRYAIQRALVQKNSTTFVGGSIGTGHNAKSYSISVQPVRNGDEDLLLVCFIEDASDHLRRQIGPSSHETPKLSELQNELDSTRAELQDAVRQIETADQDQKAINEEALSVNEEFQSTNEELLTSKEELQSLNEELTTLNSQLQDTLERQRTTSNDLQNVLYSTDVATLFLDRDLNIRFFTPATKSLFHVIPGDVGRPISDLHSLAVDSSLLDDSHDVLKTNQAIEKEIETGSGFWYLRRILPYLKDDTRVGGVVITFSDITDRKHSSDALKAAKREAELANIAKSRFLAAASHDLRQPLQTLQLLQGLLAKVVVGDKASSLVARMDDTMGAMSGMLNSLLDINQIDSGTIRVTRSIFSVSGLFARLRDEFKYVAEARGLELRVVPCTCCIDSDVGLLEQMLRNLISNALKYTTSGKVLLGCRHRAHAFDIQVWDTGIGIATSEYLTIFDEYHQLDTATGERSRGLGLGLSIVKGLSGLLGHGVSVQSRPGKGSVFSIEIAKPPTQTVGSQKHALPPGDQPKKTTLKRLGKILVIEDDVDLRDLLKLFLHDEGHRTVSASDGPSMLRLLSDGITFRPDIILTDFNLPGPLNGLELSSRVRDELGRDIPVVILTGDISTAALREIAAHDCIQITKPIRLKDLSDVLQRLLPADGSAAHAVALAKQKGNTTTSVIFVVDDDRHVRDAIRAVLEDDDRSVETYASGEEFLDAYQPGSEGCLLIDANLPGMSGIDLLDQLRLRGDKLPAIMITGDSDVSVAIRAMKAGASDFIEKPIRLSQLLADIDQALEHLLDVSNLSALRETATSMVASLTVRQRQIMDLVLAGQASKNIAFDLGISQRTVENHRASIMEKTGSKSLPALARLALAAGWADTSKPA